MKSAAPSTAGTVSTAADPSGALAFTPKVLTAKAGRISVTLANNSSVPHGLTLVDPSGVEVASAPPFTGGRKTFSVAVKAGTYSFYCTVPGHKQAGMVGTLAVG
jgi:plastocyanin